MVKPMSLARPNRFPAAPAVFQDLSTRLPRKRLLEISAKWPCRRQGIKKREIQHEATYIRHGKLVLPGKQSANNTTRRPTEEAFHQGETPRWPAGHRAWRHLLVILLRSAIFQLWPKDWISCTEPLSCSLAFIRPWTLLRLKTGAPFREHNAGEKNERDGAAGDERQPPIDREQNQKHPAEGDEVRDELRDHMGIEELKIPRVIDDAAHEIARLLIMEKSPCQASAAWHTDGCADRPPDTRRPCAPGNC